MDYESIVAECEKLSYRDMLRLAQFLIQLARKEEEIINPHKMGDQLFRSQGENAKIPNPVEYVEERVSKLKPSRKKSLINSIKSMFQYNGGISDEDIEAIIAELQERKLFKIEIERVLYPQ